MQPLLQQRSFQIAVALSVVLHAAAGAVLLSQPVRAFLQPRRTAPAPPTAVRFELVNTPQSAETDEPPADSRFASNRNTRAQDQTPRDDPQALDQPRLPGGGKSHDLRPVEQAPVPSPAPDSPPPAPAVIAAPLPAPPARRTAPVPSRPPAAAEESTARTQPEPAALHMRPAAVPREPAEAQPVAAPPPPPIPAPPVQPLPRKTPAPPRFEVAKAERELAALHEATRVQPGRTTRTALEAEAMANARVQGEFSFGATQHIFGEYLLVVKDLVEREWVARLHSDYTRVRHNRVVIDFKILASGHIDNAAVVSSVGDPYFRVVCMQSIAAAAPFPPVP